MSDASNEEDQDYKIAFRRAQIELVKFQKHVIKHDQKVVLIFEGRDAAGKDGTIKRIVEHMSPRETRIVALGVPSDRDRRAWYFQRYVEHLPIAGETVLFNRSWYNRAGVERVMGFCTDQEYDEFMNTVPIFEQLLAHCGFTILKYYLDISRKEQKHRLDRRATDPLRQWKNSPIDAKALKHWEHYSEARNDMLRKTHGVLAPWIVVRADDKRTARLNVIRDVLSRCDFHGKSSHGEFPDTSIVFPFDEKYLKNGMIAE
ncbi:MAG: polyphosphate kinase 2 [Pseudorhodoplanes sp.]